MSDKAYLKLLYIAALMSWLGSAYILFFKSPAQGSVTVVFFLASLSISLFLTFTFLSAYIAQKLARLPKPIEPMAAMRRGALLTVFAVGLLGLSMYHKLAFFDALALAIVVVLAESFFHAKFKLGPTSERTSETEE